MGTVIRIENVSKRYQLGAINSRLLYEQVGHWWETKWARLTGRASHADAHAGERELWALRDVSFDVQEGDVLGLIGHNGSGKSTLLKIISQITAPTTGRICIKGRVASLLEVGAGFHQELTGRENVFLNGAILGMSHREIAAKFDEIVAFSGVERFIDTPVKRFSSGMRVRLAFAVAAHLDAENLIVDEVLAVGDSEFQQKCIGKMGEVSRGGRTVIFVSHNAAAVENLCTRGIVLKQGRVEFAGSQSDALRFYGDLHTLADGDVSHRTDRRGTGEMRITAVEFRDRDGRRVRAAVSGQPLEIWVHYRCPDGVRVPRVTCDLTVSTVLGAPLITQSNAFTGESLTDLPARGALVCRLSSMPLVEGSYRFDLGLYPVRRHRQPMDELKRAAEVQVLQSDFFGGGKTPLTALGDGPFLVEGRWRVETGEPPLPSAAADAGSACRPQPDT